MFKNLKKSLENAIKPSQEKRQRKEAEKEQKKQKKEAEKQKKEAEKQKKKQEQTNYFRDFIEEHAPILLGKTGNNKKENPGNKDANGKGKPTTGKPKFEFPSLSQLITGTADYAEQKIDTIKNDVAEGIRRGSSQMAGAYVKTFKFFSDPYLDKVEFWLGLGNSVVEQYPILAYPGEKAREIVANTKDGFLEGADWLGNKVYEANIPIVSDLMGGLFDASSMEDSKNATSVVGSIMNGGARSILGTIDGLATIVTDPAGTVEGLVKMARDPDIYATQIWNSANTYVDEKLINGSDEDRAKVAGGLIVEVFTTAFTFGAGKAATVSKVGKMADVVDTVGDMVKIGDVTLDAARVTGRLWDDIGDAVDTVGDMVKIGDVTLDAARATGGLWDDIGDAGKWVENIDDVPAKTGVSIESVGKGAGGANKWTNPDGSVKWPPNNGAVKGTEEIVSMKPGAEIGRIGKGSGQYVAPPGTTPAKLSLKPGTDISMYNEYRILKEIPGVEKATVAPWFDQPGGGIQYKLPMSIDKLLEEGYIELIIK